MTTFKPAHAIAPALVAASLMISAPPASAAPAMNGRPDLAAVAQSNNVTEVQYRRGYRYHRGNAAAAAGIGFATGALIGAAAANAATPRYYYYDAPPYGAYGSYYEPAPSYYYEPAYRGSYGYYGSPGRATNNSSAAQQEHLRYGP